MTASHPIPGAPMRRMRHAIETRLHSLEPRAARRFGTALVCLVASYALAWLEIPLSFFSAAAESPPATSSLAAAIIARVLVGVLYVFVALGRAWARWLTVALCLLSVALVTPLLALEWRVLPLGALVTALGLACKLAAAVLLILPLAARHNVHP
ncbi:MAG TPA: hypothetical protein VGZ01_13425 [Trinickia sp.]|jgi:hypothetical protein|nr:hypothetical protein [Trinickia sp.]